MTFPEWINKDLSLALPQLLDHGEGQHLEFKESYPVNGYDLSREIAAFASSNPGTILIGITDEGGVKGLEDANTVVDRGRLCKRVEGVCSGNVRPAITPVIEFIKVEDAVVLAIVVPKGSDPVYYSNHTPYIRHLSSSRPAEPHEVIDRVRAWLISYLHVQQDEDEKGQFIASLTATVFDILIFGNEFEERCVNPWLGLLRNQLGSGGNELRNFATEDIAISEGLDGRLRSIADKLDSVVSHQLAMGDESWKILSKYVSDAVAEVQELKTEIIDPVRLSDHSEREVINQIQKSARDLADLNSRANAMVQNARIDDLQEKASVIGYSLLRASHFQLPGLGKEFVCKLQAIGHDLHLLEMGRHYKCTWQSTQQMLDRIHDLNNNLHTLLTPDLSPLPLQ